MHSAYQDGYNFAQLYDNGGVFNDLGPFPGCSQDVMTNNAHDPHDNYAQWRAGCVSNAPNPNGAPDPTYTIPVSAGNTGNSG